MIVEKHRSYYSTINTSNEMKISFGVFFITFGVFSITYGDTSFESFRYLLRVVQISPIQYKRLSL